MDGHLPREFDVPEIQALLQGVQAIAVIGGGFYFAGRITKNLETLTEVSKDHENRLRDIERSPQPY